MPNQNLTNYRNAEVYWIYCNDSTITKFYLGSSCNFFNRKNKHIERTNNPTGHGGSSLLYNFIRANGGWSNFTMSTIEPYPCDNKRELVMNEQSWIEILEPELNMVQAYQTDDQLRIKKGDLFQCSNCNKTYTRSHLTRHLKSSYCMNYRSSASESQSE